MFLYIECYFSILKGEMIQNHVVSRRFSRIVSHLDCFKLFLNASKALCSKIDWRNIREEMSYENQALILSRRMRALRSDLHSTFFYVELSTRST